MKGDSRSLKSRSTPSGCDQNRADALEAVKPLEKPKLRPFGISLRAAIKHTFGTSRAFAAALGVTEGRISQLLAGTESITPSTLEEVLATFDDVGIQEELHGAWMTTFAPSPLEIASPLEMAALSERLLGNFSSLVAAGKARPLLATLRQSIPEIYEPELRFRIQRAIIDLALYLERPSLARDGAAQMLAEATAFASNQWIATALYTRATASRIDHALPISELIQRHEAFTTFMASWAPTTKEREAYESLRQGAIRDRGLTLLAGLAKGGIKRETLNAGVKPVQRLIRSLKEPVHRAVALEVLGRLLIAEGALFAAEDVLDEVRTIHGTVSYDHAPKTKLMKAQLLIARKELDGANELLHDAIEACYDLDDIHHGQQAERIRLAIASRTASTD